MSQPSSSRKRTITEAQEDAWVAGEDRFALEQAKKKAATRVKGGRAEPIDWLSVALSTIDTDRDTLEDEIYDDIDVRSPEDVLEKLDEKQLQNLETGVDIYAALETSRSNLDYWKVMKTICQERRKKLQKGKQIERGLGTVATEVDNLLAVQASGDLEEVEDQIMAKFSYYEKFDPEFWESVLSVLWLHKANAKLHQISQSIKDAELSGKSSTTLAGDPKGLQGPTGTQMQRANQQPLATEVQSRTRHQGKQPGLKDDDDDAQSLPTAFDREVARGLGENEELLTTETSVVTKDKDQWDHKYRPRKPKTFNRVLLGYEWNKYNQTHYDHNNPPPKVVQGYKFNIFYPDLIDKMRAPTYKIEREGGRRRGESFAPAGEEDTCIIRFIAGPPYEDIAFRIVDKEWDYSSKRERGFKSTFDKGILQLHFQFRKIYYRK